MRRLTISKTIALLLLLLGLQAAQATGVPMSAARAQYLLDHLPSGPDYRDPQIYLATKTFLQSKIDFSATRPYLAEQIATEIYASLIKYSPMAPGYTPENNAKTAAAFEAYIAILTNLERQSGTAPPSAPKEPARAAAPSCVGALLGAVVMASACLGFSDPDASGAVNNLLDGASPLSFLESFFPQAPQRGAPGSSVERRAPAPTVRALTPNTKGDSRNSPSTITCSTCDDTRPSDPTPRVGVNEPTVQPPRISFQMPTVHTPQVGGQAPAGPAPRVGVRAPTVQTPQVNTRAPAGETPRIGARTPTVQTPHVRANGPSDITGVGGVRPHYQPITQSAANDIVGKYKSVPGGITLEGAGTDLSFIKTVAYVQKANAFVINGDLVYLNPISKAEFSEIWLALAKDEKLGVSLAVPPRVFGALPHQGDIAMNLLVADRLLGSIVYGSSSHLVGYNMAPGYTRQTGGTDTAVYFNFNEVVFAPAPEGELKRGDVRLVITVIPTENKNGRLVPDLRRIARGDIDRAVVANMKNLESNFSYYGRERILRRVIAYEEAAAFARSLIANKVKLELE